MKSRLLYYSLVALCCVLITASAYNAFFLLLTEDFYPLFFTPNVVVCVGAASLLYLIQSGRTWVKVFMSLLVAVVLIFVNSMMMQIPIDEYDKQMEDLRSGFIRSERSLEHFFRENKRLPADNKELIAFDVRLKNHPDPFCTDERPLGYEKLGEKKYMFYSIGPDLKDEMGLRKLAPDFNMNAYRFPWEVMFFGKKMRNATKFKSGYGGDVVLESEIVLGPKEKKAREKGS